MGAGCGVEFRTLVRWRWSRVVEGYGGGGLCRRGQASSARRRKRRVSGLHPAPSLAHWHGIPYPCNPEFEFGLWFGFGVAWPKLGLEPGAVVRHRSSQRRRVCRAASPAWPASSQLCARFCPGTKSQNMNRADLVKGLGCRWRLRPATRTTIGSLLGSKCCSKRRPGLRLVRNERAAGTDSGPRLVDRWVARGV